MTSLFRESNGFLLLAESLFFFLPRGLFGFQPCPFFSSTKHLILGLAQFLRFRCRQPDQGILGLALFALRFFCLAPPLLCFRFNPLLLRFCLTLLLLSQRQPLLFFALFLILRIAARLSFGLPATPFLSYRAPDVLLVLLPSAFIFVEELLLCFVLNLFRFDSQLLFRSGSHLLFGFQLPAALFRSAGNERGQKRILGLVAVQSTIGQCANLQVRKRNGGRRRLKLRAGNANGRGRHACSVRRTAR